MSEPDIIVQETAAAVADALAKRGMRVSEHMPGDERLEFYEGIAEQVLEDADLVSGAVAHKFKDERNRALQTIREIEDVLNRHDIAIQSPLSDAILTLVVQNERLGQQINFMVSKAELDEAKDSSYEHGYQQALEKLTILWAELLLKRDDVQGRKVLERMVEYYEEHDGKAWDFGRLNIVNDARRALGKED